MHYDKLGFPVPAEFERPADDRADGLDGERAGADAHPRRGSSGRGKRLVLLAVLLGVVIPAVVIPAALPTVRDLVMQVSLDLAIRREGRGAVSDAIDHVSRAIRWGGKTLEADPQRTSELVCWRAMLRIENRDLAGALRDVDLAASVAPTAVEPQRVRALAEVIRGDPEAALAAAEAVVELAGRNDPDALNHRAYIRAIVGRELDEALDDIQAALEGSGAGSPAFLDTRGFIYHLLGRQQEALDDLNVAIDAAQAERRRLMLLAGHVSDGALAYRLRGADQGLAVMHHHRGLACRALGLDGQATQDFAIAEQKGFDPSRGVF
jgi:tetratricopeptide (TPR) repeat protein